MPLLQLNTSQEITYLIMAEESNFEFTYLPSSRVGSFDKETEELFQKWGLKGRMHFASFSYNQHFQGYQRQYFVENFFQSPVVNASLQTVHSSSGTASRLSLASELDEVCVEPVPCTVLNMGFFDRLTANQIVRESGSIRKCFDEVCDDFIVSDELRKLLLMEDSDNYCLFNEEEREEFLFKILKHLALGGPVNQYEDFVQPYLDTSKALYKQMLSVSKDPNTQAISVSSNVFKVHAKIKGHVAFPGSMYHEQSFCYLLVDNIKRHVTAWYNIWH